MYDFRILKALKRIKTAMATLFLSILTKPLRMPQFLMKRTLLFRDLNIFVPAYDPK